MSTMKAESEMPGCFSTGGAIFCYKVMTKLIVMFMMKLFWNMPKIILKISSGILKI